MALETIPRNDLIGLTGAVTRRLTIIGAEEYPTGISVRVSDDMGEEYSMDLDDLELD